MKPALLLLAFLAWAVPQFSLGKSTIQFNATTYSVLENAGSVALTIQRTGESDTEVSVGFLTADGTATNQFKYTAVSQTLTFGLGETSKVVVVPILNNGFVEGTKNFRGILSGVTGGGVLGVRTNSTVFIVDNDLPLKAEFASYEVREDEAAVVVGVVRGDDGNVPPTVDYATADIVALAGKDYLETMGRLTFGLDEKIKLVRIPILNDGLKEPREAFRFLLSNATAVTLSPQKSATITILDNDSGIEFGTSKYFIHEDEGALQVTVNRGNDQALGEFTVSYATVNGTALAGEDYAATSGLLHFAVGESIQTFQVPIFNDQLLENDESFRVVLGGSIGDGSPGALTNLTVILCDATAHTPHGLAVSYPAEDGVVELTFTGGVSRRFELFYDLYPLEVSTNLVDWSPLAVLSRTNNEPAEWTSVDFAAGTPTLFYRTPTRHFIAAYPKPTGPYPVGRIDRMIADPDRRNRRGISTNGSFAISVWYPAAPVAGQWPARWFEEVVARDTTSASIWATYQVTQWLDRLPYLCNHGVSDAPLADVSGALPIVLYSPGFSADRREDAEKLEGLASRGYVVVSVDHDDAFDTVWPDGYYHSRSEAPTTDDDFKKRVHDLTRVLGEMAKWNQDDVRFAGRLRLDAFGAMGMSWGGPTVVELARQDSRCKALVLLDPAGSEGDLQGFVTPSLTMHRPDWGEQSVFDASTTNAVWLQISNTDHGSFGNHLLYSAHPLASNREAERTIEAYAFSFFNRWLKGLGEDLHESPSIDFPRIINFKKK